MKSQRAQRREPLGTLKNREYFGGKGGRTGGAEGTAGTQSQRRERMLWACLENREQLGYSKAHDEGERSVEDKARK